MVDVGQPRIPARKTLTPVPAGGIGPEPTLHRVLIDGGQIMGDALRHGMVEHSVMASVRFIDVTADALIVRQSRIEMCDWAGASMESASLTTCSIADSKLTGTKLNQARLKRVQLDDCRANFLQLQEAKLEDVVFERCNLGQAFFNEAALTRVVFRGCDLTGADFSGASLAGSDLRRSRIERIRIAPEQLQGVIVTPDQALYLAGVLGLDIRD